MFHFSYPPSKLENVDYSLFKQGARPQGLGRPKVLNSASRRPFVAAHDMFRATQVLRPLGRWVWEGIRYSVHLVYAPNHPLP